MNIAEATTTLRTIAAALGLKADAITVTVAPYKGNGSRSHFKGYVTATADGFYLRNWTGARYVLSTSEYRNTDLALDALVSGARKSAASIATTEENAAETARNEAQVLILRAAEAEHKAAALRAALAATDLTSNATA